MATTAAGERLTEAHRLAQAKIGAETIRLVMNVWVTLDLQAIELSIARWLEAVEPILERQARKSAALASQYVKAFERLEVGPNRSADGLIDAPALKPFDPAEFRGLLLKQGPMKYRDALRRGLKPDDASRLAQVESARAGQRVAMEGGRREVMRSGVGYQRVGSPGCCAFCAMLIGRGPVYHSARSGGFSAHPGCNCHAEPVFRRDKSAWTDQSKEFGDQYNEALRQAESGDITATAGKNKGLNALRTLRRRQGL